MGLLDWLSDGLGGFGSDGATGTQLPPGVVGAPPPVQMTGTDAPNLADPATQAMGGGQGAPPLAPPNPNIEAMPGGQGGMMPPLNPATEAMPGGQGGPPGLGQPVPLPAPRPPGADNGALPPNAAPAIGGPDTAAALESYNKAGGRGLMPTDNGGAGTSKGILESAMGLSPERAQRMRGSLAAGLKAAGENAHKPGLAALAGSAGSAMEGGQKRDDKQYDQKISALSSAIKAKSAGDEAGYKTNYLKYLNEKLAADTDKASGGGKAGKSGAWQKPDSQKFIDASNAMNKDRDIIASQKVLEAALKNGDPKAIAKAQADHAAITAQKKGEYLTGVGLDPKQIEFNMKNPPGTPTNPHKVTSQQDFNTYVKPGQAYINPKDGKTYIRKEGGDDKGGGEAAPAASKPGPVDPMRPERGTSGNPPMPTSPGSSSDDED